MHRMLSVKLDDLNQYLTCPLCKGYLIDSYTVNECLHSFCKSCIIKYVRRNESCPVCKIEIMKDRIKFYLKRDLNLQYIVYKLVPDLFKNEMKRRRTFFSTNPKAIKYRSRINIKDKEALGLLEEDVFNADQHSDISLSIEYSETGLPEICDSQRNKELDPSIQKSYLLCPPSLTIEHLKKFLCLKTGSASTQKIDIMYDDKPLSKDLTLIDIAYIYAWRRSAPMRLFYRTAKVAETAEKLSVLAEINNLPNEPVKVSAPEPGGVKTQAKSAPDDDEEEENKENACGGGQDASSNLEKDVTDETSGQVLTTRTNELPKTTNEALAEETSQALNHDLDSTMNDASHNMNEDMMTTADNHTQSINEQEHLTITGMVASISKESTQRQAGEPALKTLVSSTANSDKENDGAEPMDVPGGLIKTETTGDCSSKLIAAVEVVKKQQPKKRESKNETSISTTTTTTTNGNVLIASNENSNESAMAKKKMKMSREDSKQQQQPKKVRKPKNPAPESAQHHHHQDSDAQSVSSLESSYHLQLPFANKLNTSMTPAGTGGGPGLQQQPNNNFQMSLLNQLSSSWKNLAEQQQQQPQPQHNPYMAANYSTSHFFQEYAKHQANSMAAQVLLSQKYPPASIIEYFQTKAAAAAAAQSQFQSQQNFFNVYNHAANLHSHHHHQQQQAPPAPAPSAQQYFSNLEDFKKPIVANFASLIQETYQNNLSAHRMTHSTSNSSLHSTCGNDNSSLDSLKETQLKISESCNLVNESS